MASQLQGIQQLLQPRSETSKLKNQRLKQAKESQAEIEQFHLQREKEAKEAAALGSHSCCSTEVEKEIQ